MYIMVFSTAVITAVAFKTRDSCNLFMITDPDDGLLSMLSCSPSPDYQPPALLSTSMSSQDVSNLVLLYI